MTRYAWISLRTIAKHPLSYRACLNIARDIVPDLRLCVDRWQPDPNSGRAYQTVRDEFGLPIGTIVRYPDD